MVSRGDVLRPVLQTCIVVAVVIATVGVALTATLEEPCEWLPLPWSECTVRCLRFSPLLLRLPPLHSHCRELQAQQQSRDVVCHKTGRPSNCCDMAEQPTTVASC